MNYIRTHTHTTKMQMNTKWDSIYPSLQYWRVHWYRLGNMYAHNTCIHTVHTYTSTHIIQMDTYTLSFLYKYQLIHHSEISHSPCIKWMISPARELFWFCILILTRPIRQTAVAPLPIFHIIHFINKINIQTL